MKYISSITLMTIIGTSLISTQHLEASTYKAFVVEEVIGSNKLLILDTSSQYLITYGFGCSSWDFSSGKIIYIDTYLSPSSFNNILVESSYDTKTCNISNSETLNIKKYFVDSVIDSKDNIIVVDKYGTKYLVEYGIGCLSMWRYEGKNIDIDIGGSFLDGIGDRIYLFDSNDDCKVWDADELSSISNSPTYPLPSYDPTPPSCPTNSYSNGDKCVCVSGYIADSTKTSCMLAPAPKSLTCDVGFLIRNDRCISHTQDCINNFGSNVIGSQGPDNNSNCNCVSGYQWNTGKTACVKSTKISVNGGSSVSDMQIPEGAIIREIGGIDIYIIKYVGNKKFKRLVLSPSVFKSYGHLKWEDVMDVDSQILNLFATSDLVRVIGEDKIYRLYPQGDTGQKRLLKNDSVMTNLGFDPDSIYTINSFDRDSYISGSVIE